MCIHLSIYIYIYTYVYTYTRIYTHTHTDTCISIQRYRHRCMFTCVQTSVHPHTPKQKHSLLTPTSMWSDTCNGPDSIPSSNNAATPWSCCGAPAGPSNTWISALVCALSTSPNDTLHSQGNPVPLGISSEVWAPSPTRRECMFTERHAQMWPWAMRTSSAHQESMSTYISTHVIASDACALLPTHQEITSMRTRTHEYM